MRRPWNLAVKAARMRARVRRRRPGVTVVMVSWNTRRVTADVLEAVQRCSPSGTQVLVVDNGSTDGSREMLADWPGIDTMLFRSNPGHGVSLDLGVCAARTTVAVTLDSDAIPLSDRWLEPAVEPLRTGPVILAGTRSKRHFVHPMYLAVDVQAFVRRKLSFQVHRLPDASPGAERWGIDAWDTGELMTGQLAPEEIAFLEATPNRSLGLPGMTVGDVVYHHGGVSRQGDAGVTGSGLAEWRRACRALGLPTGTDAGVTPT